MLLHETSPVEVLEEQEAGKRTSRVQVRHFKDTTKEKAEEQLSVGGAKVEWSVTISSAVRSKSTTTILIIITRLVHFHLLMQPVDCCSTKSKKMSTKTMQRASKTP